MANLKSTNDNKIVECCVCISLTNLGKKDSVEFESLRDEINQYLSHEQIG